MAAGDGCTVSLQHVNISGYLLGAVIELPSNAQHWSTAESRVRAAALWRRNPASDVSIMPLFSLLEKKRNSYYLALVSREIGFSGEFVEGQGKSSLKREAQLVVLRAVHNVTIFFTFTYSAVKNMF